jgi:hypothetical protein
LIVATYAELLTLSEDPGLRNKVRVACVLAAEVVRTELGTVTNHAARLVWAKSVYAAPDSVAQRMLWAVLAQNQAAPLATIQAATDSTVQTAVNAAVDVFT